MWESTGLRVRESTTVACPAARLWAALPLGCRVVLPLVQITLFDVPAAD